MCIRDRITGVLGLAAVVLVHEIAEVVVILNGLRAARTGRHASEPLERNAHASGQLGAARSRG